MSKKEPEVIEISSDSEQDSEPTLPNQRGNLAVGDRKRKREGALQEEDEEEYGPSHEEESYARKRMQQESERTRWPWISVCKPHMYVDALNEIRRLITIYVVAPEIRRWKFDGV